MYTCDKKTLTVCDCGIMPYKRALVLQHELIAARHDNVIGDTLLMMEHPPVITMGRNAAKTDMLGSLHQIEQAGISVYQTDRGGQVTYHGPGQIVGYIIMDLGNYLRSIKKLVYLIEEVCIQFLKNEYNITAKRVFKHHGVWVDNKKICAVGIAVKQRITFHGFAFNIHTHLPHFQWIIPCGIRNSKPTSLYELLAGKNTEMNTQSTSKKAHKPMPTMQTAKKQISSMFSQTFGYLNYTEAPITHFPPKVLDSLYEQAQTY